MASIDLTLQPLPGREELAVLVVSPASQAGFTAPLPAALLELHAAGAAASCCTTAARRGPCPPPCWRTTASS